MAHFKNTSKIEKSRFRKWQTEFKVVKAAKRSCCERRVKTVQILQQVDIRPSCLATRKNCASPGPQIAMKRLRRTSSQQVSSVSIRRESSLTSFTSERWQKSFQDLCVKKADCDLQEKQ